MDLLDLLRDAGATDAVYAVFVMGLFVVLYFWLENRYLKKEVARNDRAIIALRKGYSKLHGKYHLLNTNFVRIVDRVDPSLVLMHHTSDYSIKDPMQKD